MAWSTFVGPSAVWAAWEDTSKNNADVVSRAEAFGGFKRRSSNQNQQSKKEKALGLQLAVFCIINNLILIILYKKVA